MNTVKASGDDWQGTGKTSIIVSDKRNEILCRTKSVMLQ